MSSNAVPEASEIRRRGRQRLIGAVVLVALLVVFVPMVLDSDPRPTRPGPSSAIPSKENAPPLPAPARPAVAAGVQPKAVDTKLAEAPKVADTRPADAPKAADTKPADTPKPAVEKPAETPKPAAVEPATAAAATAPSKVADAAVLQGFAVQVGAFRDEAKLKQSREKLVSAGVVHYIERLESKGGPLTRLRAGPFATRGEAEAALVKLKRASVDGKVVPLP